VLVRKEREVENTAKFSAMGNLISNPKQLKSLIKLVESNPFEN
jgi:hypothetical protein